jgi:hypothetical protein
MPKRAKEDPKVSALKKHGTLNPHPEKVVDDLFNSMEFFDARDLMQVKYEMLRRVKEDGWTISQAAIAFGFSRPSFYEAQSDFEQSGLAGFIPERRGPREAHKLSGPVVNFIEEVRQRDGIDVHRRSIERALVRAKKKLQ